MGSFKAWAWVHKWSSLISTAFLLILCVTGLPLIFHDEIDEMLGHGLAPSTGAPASLSAIERAGLEAKSGWSVQYFVWEPDKPGVITLSMAPAGSTSFYDNQNVLVDAHTAQVVPQANSGGPMEFILALHSQLLIGPWGPLILGFAAMLFLVALVSGLVIYAPFARGRPFADIRMTRARATKWLDLHNVVGAAIVAWALVVGATGLVNTWGEYIIRFWQATELAAYATAGSAEPGGGTASVEQVVAAAKARLPNAEPYFVAYPKTLMGGESFFAVYTQGDTALTRFVYQPVLVDAQSGRVIAVPELPWYIKALGLSQPLHFGDYGGLVLKIFWALLDVAAIFTLGSGLFLTLRRRRGDRPPPPEGATT